MTRFRATTATAAAGVVLMTLCACASNRAASRTSVAPVSAGTASPAPAGSGSGSGSATDSPDVSAASSIDPCALFTAGDAQTTLGATVAQPSRQTGAGTIICTYHSPLVIIAVIEGSFTSASFHTLITSQDSGPYAATVGKSVAVAGLGDAAFSYAQGTIVEALKGATAISVTTQDPATSTKVARAALTHLP